jgi:hypothetical protein
MKNIQNCIVPVYNLQNLMAAHNLCVLCFLMKNGYELCNVTH